MNQIDTLQTLDEDLDILADKAQDALDVITRRAVGGEDIDRVLLLNSVEGLFRV